LAEGPESHGPLVVTPYMVGVRNQNFGQVVTGHMRVRIERIGTVLGRVVSHFLLRMYQACMTVVGR
ncbi:hypothetical protein RYX56_24955, partial [Alkalihalophilus lindianensis]